LHSLTQKDTSFEWNEKCTDAFTNLKRLLIQLPVLGFHGAAAEFSCRQMAVLLALELYWSKRAM
jgi:hypothetical protein